MSQNKERFWSRIFRSAAIFNFAMGLPIFLFPLWSNQVAYLTQNIDVANTYRFWRDFGFTVVVIGIGYYIVSLDITKNRGIVWLGIIGKLYDVSILSYRFIIGIAGAFVLVPVIVDAIYVLLFILFLRRKYQDNSGEFRFS
ncbi:hypothetical protein [Maribellus mangrovi]|uniref:hypothetical protein n=1 Tax=Maribellus mangrovi TaxID=3133146 RepID=UPI0030EFA143